MTTRRMTIEDLRDFQKKLKNAQITTKDVQALIHELQWHHNWYNYFKAYGENLIKGAEIAQGIRAYKGEEATDE